MDNKVIKEHNELISKCHECIEMKNEYQRQTLQFKQEIEKDTKIRIEMEKKLNSLQLDNYFTSKKVL